MLFSMPIVMFKLIILIFQGVKYLVFNMPSTPASSDP